MTSGIIKKIRPEMWAAVIIITLFYLCEFRFFFLLPLPDKIFAGSTNKMMLAMFSFGFFILFLLKNKKLGLGYFGWPIIFAFLSVAVSTVLSKFEFGFSITQVLWGIIPYLILLLYFPGRKYLADKDTMECFIVIGEILAILMSAIFILQYILYTGSESTFLKLPGMISDVSIRHPEWGLRVRNVFDGLFRVFGLIIADRIIVKRFRGCWLDIISYFAIVLAVLMIDQSRAYLVTLMFSSIAILIYRSIKKVTVAKLLIGTGAIAVGVVAIIVKMSSIFVSIAEKAGSWMARVNAASHYIDVGLDHFFFGIGMADHESNREVANYVRGISGIYYPDDVGLIGLFALLGITGLIVYVIIMVRVIKCFLYAKQDQALLFGLVISMIMSSIITTYFDRTRLLALVLTAIVCDINRCQRWKENELDNTN